MIIGIFKKLGVDQTIFAQFIVATIFLFLLDFLFFSKLKEVLMDREARTTKLVSSSEDKENEAEELESKYQREISSGQASAQEALSKRRNEALNKIAFLMRCFPFTLGFATRLSIELMYPQQ